MPRSRSRQSQPSSPPEHEEEEEEEELDLSMMEEEEDAASTQQQKKKKRSKKRKSHVKEEELDDDEEDEGEDQDHVMTFSSQLPECSQNIAPVRAADRNNLMKMGEEGREKAISDLLQLVLFKGLAGEPIDRQKIVKEAGINDARISTAAFEEVNERLQSIFAFQLSTAPDFMLNGYKDFPAKYKDRYYIVNCVADDDEQSGNHTRTLHGVHKQGCVEKGFLMTVLGFIFCQGEPRADGSRWLLDKELYALLHKMDENIHSEPPMVGVKRNRRPVVTSTGWESPNADALLSKFVYMDYLMTVKASANEQLLNANENAEENSIFYAMGARAAVEIGRSQIIWFVGESLDEEPDESFFEGIDGDGSQVEA